MEVQSVQVQEHGPPGPQVRQTDQGARHWILSLLRYEHDGNFEIGALVWGKLIVLSDKIFY